MTQSRMLPAADVMRSRMILLLADGVSYQKIQDLLDTTAPTIARWKSLLAASHRRFNGGTASRPAALSEDTETAGQGAGRD
jgi:transposase